MADEIQILKDFVEGKLSDKDFEQQLYTNQDLEKQLSNPAIDWQGTYLQNTTAYFYLIEQDYKNAEGRLNAHGAVQLFLSKIGVEIIASPQKSDEYEFILSTSPKYIDTDAGFIEQYILPKDKTLSKSEQKQYIKQRYTELFKFQTKPPKWIQNPEWPVKNNLPLFFLGQIEIKKGEFFHDEGSMYLFMDPATGIMETVKQFY
ncbi:hypothetical protein [Chryseobacterium sp. JM1]|uniref:hypothetical protein n=1 Tax=Chryseobacterium sp. JM1 TaxID=1233950 RepID=UPI0004E6C945|nr:hypothetical protein [Chryseobacterium sp. JM1]KFF19242.1 hypothetical protein IW22_16370 [Chryseobacterium sp. JM1]